MLHQPWQQSGRRCSKSAPGLACSPVLRLFFSNNIEKAGTLGPARGVVNRSTPRSMSGQRAALLWTTLPIAHFTPQTHTSPARAVLYFAGDDKRLERRHRRGQVLAMYQFSTVGRQFRICDSSSRLPRQRCVVSGETSNPHRFSLLILEASCVSSFLPTCAGSFTRRRGK